MKSKLLERMGRSERLRDIVKRVQGGESFSAFRLAVEYDVSINVVYRDIKALRDEGLIPKDFKLAKRASEGRVGCTS
jgi:predicted DNA-binding transcriptional regulator YafY